MADDLHRPVLDPEDAREIRLRLGVLTSTVIEYADVLCVDVGLMQLDPAPDLLQGYLRDASTLTAAMEVLARRSRPVRPVSPST